MRSDMRRLSMRRAVGLLLSCRKPAENTGPPSLALLNPLLYEQMPYQSTVENDVGRSLVLLVDHTYACCEPKSAALAVGVGVRVAGCVPGYRVCSCSGARKTTGGSRPPTITSPTGWWIGCSKRG